MTEQTTRITLCSGCKLGQGDFADRLREGLSQAGVRAEVARIDCMSGCARPSTAAFRAVGKTAYLFGDLTDADLTELLSFARLYGASPDGNLPDARLAGGLRRKAIARIPGGETA